VSDSTTENHRNQPPTGQFPSVRFRHYLYILGRDRQLDSDRHNAASSFAFFLRWLKIGSKIVARKKMPWSAPTLTEVYPSQKSIDHLKALYKHQAEQAGQPDDVWIPPPSPGQRILNETLQQRTVGGPSQDAWQKCYELARAIEGEAGATLVDLARQNGADLDDVLAGIEVSHKTGKPLDYELASFLD
jgi:hypothetical protein